MEGGLLVQNLTSPVVLCFILGAMSVAARSDLRIPEAMSKALGIYLLVAIGWKGGVALRDVAAGAVVGPAIATVILGLIIPLATFAVAHRIAGIGRTDAGAIACHYGSVSAVTFSAAATFVRSRGIESDGFLPALVALMEAPGILVGLLLAKGASNGGFQESVRELITGKSVILLVGGLMMGRISNPDGVAAVKPFLVDLFPGVLMVFMLDLGMAAAKRIRGLRSQWLFAVPFGILAPILFGFLGVLMGKLSGMTIGGSAVLGAMSASASYIAAPAAVRPALPEADEGLYLGMALGVTFPFNLALGIPVYVEIAKAIV